MKKFLLLLFALTLVAKEEYTIPLEEEKILTASPIITSNKKKKSITNKKKKKKKKKKKQKHLIKKRTKHFYEKYSNRYTRYYTQEFQKSIQKLKSKKALGTFDYKYAFNVRLSYDFSFISEAQQSYKTAGWRRVRLSHSGTFQHETLFYEIGYSLTGTSHYKNLYIGYQNKITPLNLKYRTKFGNIKIPFSLEQYSSSKNITFIERPLTDTFFDSRKIGAELLLSQPFYKNTLNLFLCAFINSIDEERNNETKEQGEVLRLTYSYKANKRNIIALGGAFMHKKMKNKKIKFKGSSESAFIHEKYLSLKLKQVQTLQKLNLESLYIHKKYSLQAEYTQVDTQSQKKNNSINGYYIEGSYFPIGKGRRYKTQTSTLSKVKPSNNGAVEVALRYSYLNLHRAGSQRDYNFALNDYINSNLKLMFNYIIVEPKNTPDYNGRFQLYEFRVALAF